MQELRGNNDFRKRIVFREETTFHVSGTVNKHNFRIWGSEHVHAVIEHVRDSPKVNVFAAISIMNRYEPLVFAEKKNVSGLSYLDMLLAC